MIHIPPTIATIICISPTIGNYNVFMHLALYTYLITIVCESFKDYIAVEMLEGENKYDAEKFGLQVSLLLLYYPLTNYMCV